jgi:Galactose-1-phosphate uridylyltransferase
MSMSELRWDPLKLHWVIIATERGRRPRDFQSELEPLPVTSCPFCYGNEDKTPPEIFAIRPSGMPNTPNWKVRVIPNKYRRCGLKVSWKTGGMAPMT